MREGRSFEHTPDSVPAARHFAREVVRGATADTVEAIELMVSELATNCVRHTDSGFDLAITLSSEEIRVEVADRGVGEPGMRTPGPSDPSGRGLRIVDMLSSDWGHEKRPGGGKTVWFTIAPEGESTAAGVDAERAGHAHEEHASRRVTRAFDEGPVRSCATASAGRARPGACRSGTKAIRPRLPQANPAVPWFGARSGCGRCCRKLGCALRAAVGCQLPNR